MQITAEKSRWTYKFVTIKNKDAFNETIEIADISELSGKKIIHYSKI